ncbi:MAG: SRPBCC family protein [Bacteroidetes bacterium]|nr:SRPBCC family protein [Bacteroidota bacterium]
MKTLTRKQILSLSIEEAWSFFSNPANLSRITPQEMNFRIMNPDLPPAIYAGLIIRYTVKPMWNIPLTWITEISQVREPWYFVDEQLSGPFKVWHHQHIFRKAGNKTEMEDIVNYQAPLGPVGRLAEWLTVDNRVVKIFDHREALLRRLFPS